MPRKEMASPAKRRPPPATGAKPGNSSTSNNSTNTSNPRSPPRPTRTSPSSARTTNTKTNNSTAVPSTLISPPPRAALSGASSPAPDNPRNTTSATASTDSPRLAPIRASSRNPSPAPALPPRNLATANAASIHPPAPSHPPDMSPLPNQPSHTGPTSASASATATASAVATYQAALRERDLRIASLERELALMESEFIRELDKLSTAESETAAFWQGKCAVLEERVAGLLSQGAGAGGVQVGVGGGNGVGGGHGSCTRELELEAEAREFRGAWERAQNILDQKEGEMAKLKAQVRGLKEWVSVSTRADGEARMSDEVFGEGMAKLGNGLQNWVLVNFRRAKIGEWMSGCRGSLGLVGRGRGENGRSSLTRATTDLSGADEATISELARLVPMYEELASTSKINLLQSAVSRLFVELVFDAYFVGLPADVAAQIKQVEGFLSSAAASPESINQWRSLTLTILKKDANANEPNNLLEHETAAVIHTVISHVNALLDPLTHTQSNDTRDQGLQALVTSAVELSRLLAVQKAVFSVEMPVILPHQRTVFDAETMEDIGGGGDGYGYGDDDDDGADAEGAVGDRPVREICCVTFPGIIKRGDESGAHLQYRNVIAKAKVLCVTE
ncbi:uncharacterized protein C8A04DRAFT_9817 [Dichotomopilus funicola]|uniref:Uncharacterized protein n=1 Tax=Dichotomopilus funicola TaxID=1934379 RepID=A0AAN6ZQN7_9PEZI|nr:hypothetical protein C8A04DRAFT_9817 [Dichotomopilus funicola]